MAAMGQPGSRENSWKQGGRGSSGANLSEKTLTIFPRAHTLIKLKFGQFWLRNMGRDAGVAQW
jgi:hypothetical protein